MPTPTTTALIAYRAPDGAQHLERVSVLLAALLVSADLAEAATAEARASIAALAVP